MSSVILSSYFDRDKHDGFTNQLNQPLTVGSIALTEVVTQPHSFFNVREPDNKIEVKYNEYLTDVTDVVSFEWIEYTEFVGNTPDKKYGRFRLKNGLVIYSEDIEKELDFREFVGIRFYYDQAREKEVKAADIEMDIDLEIYDAEGRLKNKISMYGENGKVFSRAVTKVYYVKPGFYGTVQELLDAMNTAIDGLVSICYDTRYNVKLSYRWPDAMYPIHMRWFGKDYDPNVDSIPRWIAWHAAKGRVAGFTVTSYGRPCFMVDGLFSNECHLRIRLSRSMQYLFGYTNDVSQDIGWHAMFPVIELVSVNRVIKEGSLTSDEVVETSYPQIKTLMNWPQKTPTTYLGLWYSYHPADMTRITISSLWVYCDVIQPNIVNSTMEPLLRVIPYDRSGSVVGYHIIGNLHYCTPSRDPISAIKIWFKDAAGKLENLHIHGEVIVKLDCQ